MARANYWLPVRLDEFGGMTSSGELKRRGIAQNFCNDLQSQRLTVFGGGPFGRQLAANFCVQQFFELNVT
jgi:hypothetical protein